MRTLLLLALFSIGCGDDSQPRPLFPDDMGGDVDMLGDAAEDQGTEPDTGNEVDMESDLETDQGNGFCTPNRDGVIERHEVTLQAGLNAKFRVSTAATFDSAGEEVGGQKVWDMSGDLTGDMLTVVELQRPDDYWFAPDFANATYVSRLSAGADLLGIFQVTDSGLLLLGVASPESGFTSTKLTYDPPVEVLKFPITSDSLWQTEAQVSGTALGIFSFYSEKYTTRSAGSGLLKTPFADFPVTRLRVELERTVGLLTTTVRQYVFVTECFGTVATIRSADNEPDLEFDSPAEIRRIAP